MNHVTVVSHQPYLVVESPYQLARWRPLVNWVLYIPHGIILYALQILSHAVFLVYWLMLIFTGRLHPGMFGVMAIIGGHRRGRVARRTLEPPGGCQAVERELPGGE